MMESLVKIIIPMQIPIVLFLCIVWYQAYKSLKIEAFKYLACAWAANLAYLICNLTISQFRIEGYTSFFLVSLLDITGTFFILFAIVQPNHAFASSHRILKIIRNNVSPKLIGVVLISALAVQIIPDNPENDLLPAIVVRSVPHIFLNSLSLMALAFYFGSLEGKYGRNNYLITGAVLYSLVQWLAMFDVDQIGSANADLISVCGYTIGFCAKLLLLVGSVNLIGVAAKKDLLARRLKTLLGETFHEIVTPMRSTDVELIELVEDSNSDLRLSKGARKAVNQIWDNHHRMLAIVEAGSMAYEAEYGESLLDNGDLLLELRLRRGNKNLNVHNINSIIQIAILNIKHHLLSEGRASEDVSFLCDYGAGCDVLMDQYKMTQVFVNLFKNSREAFTDGRGMIAIRTRGKYADSMTGEISKGIHVLIQDSGKGISREYEELVYNSGFSTKGLNRGLGLGIVKRIVEKEHFGSIELVSDTVRRGFDGACFSLKFPTVENAIEMIEGDIHLSKKD